MNPWNDYVISDVRFPNEINFIKKKGGLVFRIRRGEDPEWLKKAQLFEYDNESLESYMRVKHPEVHESEWAWANCEFDFTINNDMGLYELEQRLKEVLSFYSVYDSMHDTKRNV
jgi:hypothetical protein